MTEANTTATVWSTEVRIQTGDAMLSGELSVPERACGIVLFAHGSGSSRHSPRNQFVAQVIRNAGIGTLLFDLLTIKEESVDAYTRHLRFNIGLLANRLVQVTQWITGESALIEREARPEHQRPGYFGSSTGAAAALVAAARLGDSIGAVVSRGGRPDLAGAALEQVKSPILLIVGGHDEPVIELNESAYERLQCRKELRIVRGATHLFEEPGALQEVARLATGWFSEHLREK